MEENYWLNTYLTGRLGDRSTVSANGYVSWFQSNVPLSSDGTAMGASASYSRLLTDHLSATAALGIDGISRETLPDQWTASALVGVRYTF